ncbi:hypothetical protein RQP46_011059 [Phenoliferia psychrophenolica]
MAGKAPRHRKKIRSAREGANAQPLGGSEGGAQPAVKKVGKKEAEVTNLLDKLRSTEVDERVWASAALSGMLLDLPAVTLRLLLSRNLIGLLIERLADSSDSVVVESLGALRNLAVTQPLSLLSEMHNKRLLLPLTSTHLPLLASLLPTLLGPTPPPITAPLPSTPADREAAQVANEHAEHRRRLFWDWTENVVFLLWALAESNTKILASLNAVGQDLIVFLGALVRVDGDEAGGEDAKGGKKGKKAAAVKSVPVGVALAAAQTLHALISSNPPAQAHLFAPASHSTLSSLTHILSTPTPATTPAADTADHLTLRVVSFGILLDLTTSSAAKKPVNRASTAALKDVLKQHSDVLVGLVRTDLNQDPKSTEGGQPPSGTGLDLVALEKKLSTLQLSLETLSEWCASLDAEGLGAIAAGGSSSSSDEGEEEWNGIPDDGGDVEMGDEDDEEEEEEEDEIIQKDPHAMEDDDAEDAPLALTESALSLFTSLPSLLLALASPTPISFAPPPAPPTPAPATLLPTSTASTPTSLPLPLHPLSALLTTIHVRALECLNNLYITLARSVDPARSARDLQQVWEGTLGLVLQASQAAVSPKSAGEEDDAEDRHMEVVMAGVGAAWGMARVGLGEGGDLIVGEQATPFLVGIFSHPFATAATPAAESIRVRVCGCLGWLGRRSTVSASENETIGRFLLSLLPSGKAASPLAPTPEVLLQAIDSLIDLYSDEDSPVDVPVFRNLGFLERLDDAVPGVRAATKRIDKKKFPELRARADGALENLVAFVQYRRDVAR